MAVGITATHLRHLPPFWFNSYFPDTPVPQPLSTTAACCVLEWSRERERQGEGERAKRRIPVKCGASRREASCRVCAGVPSSCFFRPLSDGGTVVAGGGGVRVGVGRGRGRGQSSTAAKGFSDVRHQEGVAGQLQHVHAVLLVISQATSNEGLQQEGGKKVMRNCRDACLCLLCFLDGCGK